MLKMVAVNFRIEFPCNQQVTSWSEGAFLFFGGWEGFKHSSLACVIWVEKVRVGRL